VLDPEVRRLYSECFAAPPGHALECAVGTTYSLDLDSLLFALFCLATSGVEDPDGALGNPVALLEAIHRLSDHVTLFAHAGETHAPERPRALYALLERCMVPAHGRGGAIFHPKLWVLRYRSRSSDAVLMRVVVLSRNLTSSRAWDTFVCLEGSPGGAVCDESRELGELLRALPSFAVAGQGPAEARLAQLESLAHAVERTRFEAPSPFEGTAAFVALGVVPGRRFEPSPGSRLLAISPFVSSGTLGVLRALAPRAQLVGRGEEMAKCSPDVLARWEAFVLHEGASADAEVLDDGANEGAADAAPQGLHAKVLVVESNQRATWWLGSANLTDPVRSGASVELMVRLGGKIARVGIDHFWDSGFGALLVSYQHHELPPDPADGNRSSVQRAQRRIIEAALELRCEVDGGGWCLSLEGGLPDLDDVVATCRPVSLAPSREVNLSGGVAGCRFVSLSAEALTAFLAIRLVAGSGDARFELAFTLKLPIKGLPEERDARVASAIIKDRAAFMSYLRCLLADFGSTSTVEAQQQSVDRAAASQDQALRSAGLLESLLRTLHRDPGRLHGLRTLLARCAPGSAEDVIPEEMRAIWAAIEPHLSVERSAAE
jgi:hypothetical protein